MPEDYFHPITFNDEELGFGSIFDGYSETLYDNRRSSLLVDSDDNDEEVEEERSSDEEVDLKKKWKSSTKTTMNKYVN